MLELDIKEFYRNILNVSDPNLIQTLATNSRTYFVQKGNIITNIGDLNTKICFLKEGLFRGFFFDINGREITDCFGFIPGTPAVSCLDLDMPTPIGIEALEDCTLVSISFEVLSALIKSDMQIMNIYNQLLKTSLKVHWEIKIMLAQYTASERYMWFLERFPGLIERISHKYIASFLGITPVQLSRIRRAIREKEDKN